MSLTNTSKYDVLVLNFFEKKKNSKGRGNKSAL